jgi:hypothetical protein
MATLWFQGFYDDLLAGNVSGADIRSILVMTDTTCDTDETAQVMSDFVDIDECDGVGYAELDHTVSSNAYDGTDDRWEIHVGAGENYDGGGGTISGASRDVQGHVIYRYVDGTDANDVPWLYSDDPSAFPFTPTGGAAGFTQHADALIIIEPEP